MRKMLRQLYKKSFRLPLSVAIVISVSYLGVYVHTANAASLLIAPSTAKVSTGNIVSMKVLVNTDGKAINNADALIQFPIDLLEVVSVSKTSSIFSLWVEEPKFSNVTGTISLNGGLPNPGYTGQNGEVLAIVFKAKKQGNASVVFSDSSVRANDGLGTDLLSAKQSATIQIVSAAQLEVPAVTTSSNSLPAKPIVTSSTHPQQDVWYQGKNASFSWSIPNDVDSIQTLLGKGATTVPTVTYDGSVSQRTVNNLTDGVLYFHIRYHNSVGWGPITHYKVQIDSTSPEKFNPDVRIDNAQNILRLNATDTLSGIDSYSIKIDEDQAISVKKDSLINAEYVLPIQTEGEHRLSVVAYDKAGNHTEANTMFVSPTILAPVIEVTPVEVKRGAEIMVSGETKYPNSDILVFIQSEEGKIKSYSTKTSPTGIFSLESDALNEAGSANVWAQLVFREGVKSPVSNKVTVHVLDSVIVKTSKSTIYALSFIVPAAILLLGLLFMLYLGWHKFFGLKRKISKDVQGTVNEIHKSLMAFKDELENQLGKLEKIREDRELNKKEEKIFRDLEKNIDGIDEFIEKKLKKVK